MSKTIRLALVLAVTIQWYHSNAIAEDPSAKGVPGDWISLFDGETTDGWHRQRERGQHGTGGRWE